MKIEHLTEAFVKHGARKDGNSLIIPEHVDASLFVALPGETLGVARIAKLEHHDGLLYADTHKGEHFVCSLEDVAVVKIDREADKKRERSAGFGK